MKRLRLLTTAVIAVGGLTACGNASNHPAPPATPHATSSTPRVHSSSEPGYGAPLPWSKIQGSLERGGFKIVLDPSPNISWGMINIGSLQLSDTNHPGSMVNVGYVEPHGSMEEILARVMAWHPSAFYAPNSEPAPFFQWTAPDGLHRVEVASLQKPHILLLARSYTQDDVRGVITLVAADRNGDGRPGDGGGIVFNAHSVPGNTADYHQYLASLLASEIELLPTSV